jgi:hypothetical protein
MVQDRLQLPPSSRVSVAYRLHSSSALYQGGGSAVVNNTGSVSPYRGIQARAGSAQILNALDRAGQGLGIAISALVNIIDVDTVLLDGSYSLRASWLTDGHRAGAARACPDPGVGAGGGTAAPLGPDAAVIGAALSAVDTIRRDPNSWFARVQR